MTDPGVDRTSDADDRAELAAGETLEVRPAPSVRLTVRRVDDPVLRSRFLRALADVLSGRVG